MTSMTQTAEFPPAVTPLVEGMLYAVGWSVPADRPLTFMAPGATGWLPFQGFVMRDGDEFLLIDSGLSLHRDRIREALDALSEGYSERRVAMTRRELDSILNIPWIVPRYDICKIHFAGDINPLDFFESMDAANAEGLLRSAADVDLHWLTHGSEVKVGRYTLEAVRPAIRLLSSYWYHEASTRTLFSSDLWAYITRPDEGGPKVIEPSDDQISVDAIYDHLMAKFDWLRGIDPAPVIDGLEEIFASREVELICPNYGCIIKGKDAIARLKANTIEALKRAGAEPRRSVMEGFDWVPEVA